MVIYQYGIVVYTYSVCAKMQMAVLWLCQWLYGIENDIHHQNDLSCWWLSYFYIAQSCAVALCDCFCTDCY